MMFIHFKLCIIKSINKKRIEKIRLLHYNDGKVNSEKNFPHFPKLEFF